MAVFAQKFWRRHGSIPCPHCGQHLLTPLMFNGIEVDGCNKCGGLWFEQGELDQVIRQRDPQFPMGGAHVGELGQRVRETNMQCPDCRSMLACYNFSDQVELEIDVCEHCHGIWLERGELHHATLLTDHVEALEQINRKRSWGNWFFQLLSALPVEFNIKPKRFPIVTVCLIVACLIAFVCQLLVQSPEEFVMTWGFLPKAFPDKHWFIGLLSYQFLHGGVFHLLGNMYFLFILGDNVEDAMGRGAYLIFYLFCGIIGALAFAASNIGGDIPMVGASGAIAGIMGAYIVIFRRAQLTFMLLVFQFKMPAVVYFLIWIFFNVVGWLAGGFGVAWSAHIGGFVAGVIVAYFMYPKIVQAHPILLYLAKRSKKLAKQN